MLNYLTQYCNYTVGKRMPTRRQMQFYCEALKPIVIIAMARCLLNSILKNGRSMIYIVSNSMSPGIEVGDLLFFKANKTVKTGQIVMYQANKNYLPIIHRIINQNEDKYFTKGDNNSFGDNIFYMPGQETINRGDILSNLCFILPYVGYVYIFMYVEPVFSFTLFFFLIIGFKIYVKNLESRLKQTISFV